MRRDGEKRWRERDTYIFVGCGIFRGIIDDESKCSTAKAEEATHDCVVIVVPVVTCARGCDHHCDEHGDDEHDAFP